MKRRIILAIIAIIVAIIVVLGSVFGWTESVKSQLSLFGATEQGESVAGVANATSETATTHEPTAEVSDEAECFRDGNGKNYYTTVDSALKINTLQGRVDASIILRYNVYDVLVPQNDIVVKDALGNDIVATSQLDLNDIDRVELLRDGEALLVYSYAEDAFRVDTGAHEFAPAKDEGFSEKVFCRKHRAIRSAIHVGYTGEVVGKWNVRGAFHVGMLDNIFTSFILVKRNVVMEDGSVHEMCTWVVRECECGTTIHEGGNPAQPTDAPTAKPTNAPTVKPTDAPTAKPTEDTEPQPTPTPTAKPTKPAEDTEPQPTPTPTAKPTKPAEDTEPQPTPTAPSKPIEKPGEDTGNQPTKPPVVTPVETLGPGENDFLAVSPSKPAEKPAEDTGNQPTKPPVTPVETLGPGEEDLL